MPNSFLGEASFEFEGQTLNVRLDMNALRLWAEAEGCEFQDLADRLSGGDFVHLCNFFWHGHRGACHRVGTIPQMDRQQFLSVICEDPEYLADVIQKAMGLGEAEGGEQ